MQCLLSRLRVLILVLLDDGLVLQCLLSRLRQLLVLILVLLDDGLVPDKRLIKIRRTYYGLNPCFVGRWTSTSSCVTCSLVVNCLNPCFVGRWTSTAMATNPTNAQFEES